MGGQVWAVRTGNGGLYVGGKFTTVNGRRTGPLVKLDPDTGAVVSRFDPPFNGGQVNALRYRDGTLYVGGSFPGRLLALNPRTGANTGKVALGISGAIPGARGTTSIFDFAINPDRTKIAATGNFLSVSGQSRARFFMANLNPTTGRASLDNWYYPGLGRRVRRVTSPGGQPARHRLLTDGSYFVVVATGQIPARRSTSGTQAGGTRPTPPSAMAPAGSRCPTTPNRDGSTTQAVTVSGRRP